MVSSPAGLIYLQKS